jgi:hypothetical protein
MAGSYTTPAKEAVEHAHHVFNLFKSVSGIKRFRGRVADVGPGDSCSLALLFLADGCEHVDLADRFSFSDSLLQQEINRLIAEESDRLISDNGTFSESSFSGLQRHSGEDAAAEKFFALNKGYDFIVSAATLEHVYDPLSALTSMASALNPGGAMIHGIDFRDHGQFSESFHDLKFLELPTVLYAPFRWQGGPNRVRLSTYVKHLEGLGFTVDSFATFIAGTKEEIPPSRLNSLPSQVHDSAIRLIAETRPHLSKRFKYLPDEDLMAAGMVIVARKT